MRKAHTPGQGCRLTVVSISRSEAAKAAHRVSDGGGRGSQVQHAERSNFVDSSLPHQRQNSGDKTAKPREAGSIKEHGKRTGEKFVRRFHDMP